jgi:bifunctional oligoribonuclease and PAP phosphatase NrnA
MSLEAPELLPQIDELKTLVQNAHIVVIVQADNPDGDSLGSALALEQILGDMGKQPYLYCGVDMPTYLHNFEGWDRVQRELPTNFDLSIIVDTSADSLLDSLRRSHQEPKLASKPCLVIDHHPVESTIHYASLVYCQKAVATAELIYEIAHHYNWKLNDQANRLIVSGILSDSLGLTSEATTARSIYIVAALVNEGVNLAELENRRRELMRKSPDLLSYKGQLLQKIEYFDEGKIATVTIGWDEIQKYSHEYNPSMLVLDEMRLVENVCVAIAFKVYGDGKITGKIRTNIGSGVADKLAEHFGGGGHTYASGFKVSNGKSIDDIKHECISVCSQLLRAMHEQG